MSGLYTVESLCEMFEKQQYTPEESVMLKAMGFVTSEGKANHPNLNLVKEHNKIDPSATVFLAEEGGYIFEVIDKKKTEEEVKKPAGVDTSKVFAFSADKVKEIIEAKSLSINQDKIQVILERYIQELPKTTETYKSSSVVIKAFKGVEIQISSLLSSGTKILDAILYMAYKDSPAHNFIFSVHNLQPTTIKADEMVENIDIGNKAIKAAFCCVYNQGGLPSETSDQKTLSKFIRETIFRKTDLTSNNFCKMLSSTDPAFFPAAVFLKVKIEHLPSEVSSRCKMSIAGNKAVRYAVLAKRFEEGSIVTPKVMEGTSAADYLKNLGKLEKAKSITNALSALASNPEAQKRMHPCSPERSSRKNFTLQLTCAIIFSLSPSGRSSLRNYIDEKNIAAFKRDENIYGTRNALDTAIFPVLMNSEADFSELSIDAVNSAYGVTK